MTFTSYQYAGNNSIMYNDPLGDKMMPPQPGGGPSIILHNGVVDQLNRDAAQYNSDFQDASSAEGGGDDGGGDDGGAGGVGGGSSSSNVFGGIFRGMVEADHNSNYYADNNNSVIYNAHNPGDAQGAYINYFWQLYLFIKTTAGTVFGAYNSVTGYFQNLRSFKIDEAKFKSIMEGTARQRAQTAFNLCRDFATQGSKALIIINCY